MPAYIFSGIIILLCVAMCYYIIKKRKADEGGDPLKRRIINAVMFCFSLFSFAISLILFRNMGIYANDYGASTVDVAGGWFWLQMDVVRLGLLFAMCLISGVRLFQKSKERG